MFCLLLGMYCLIGGQPLYSTTPVTLDRAVSVNIDTTLLFKHELLKYFAVDVASIKTSRKSCNCDCDIKKETYLKNGTASKLEVIDFCDSMEFGWHSDNGNIDTLLKDLRQIFVKLGYQGLNEDPIIKYKRKTYMIDIETDSLYTFLELREWEDGRVFMRLSIISELGKTVTTQH